MKFDLPPPATTKGFRKRDQTKLLILLGGLVLVVVLIGIARKPATWAIFAPQPAAPAEDPAQPAPEGQTIPPAAVVMRNDGSREEADPTPDDAADPSALPSGEAGEAELDFSVVEDRFPQIRADEEPLVRILLDRTGDWTPADERRLPKAPAYVDLTNNPSLYRGEPFRVRGELRVAYETTVPGTNRPLFEAWIWTSESGTRPIMAYVTSMPARTPLGEPLKKPIRVEFASYFFKLRSYLRQDEGSQIAPFFLGGALRRYEPAAAAGVPENVRDFPIGRWVLYGAVGLTALVGLLVYFMKRDDRRFERRLRTEGVGRHASDGETARSELSALEREPVDGPEQLLAKLESEPTETPDPS